MNRSPALNCCGACLLTFGLTVSALAEPLPAERVLLLRTGRVVKGQIQRISTGWLVNAKHGRVVVPADQVRFDADNVEEIYLSLRLQLVRDPTVGKHLNLADWCLSQKMLPKAALEVRSAMALDPENETARLMLKRLQAHIARENGIDDPKPEEPAPRAHVEVDQSEIAARTEVRSLAGLRPLTAQQFVRSIQPILFNRCGNARCHGPSASNGFRLERFRVGSGSHRLKSERNLAAILKHVDAGAPLKSPVLEPANGSHAGTVVFRGSAAASQAEFFRKWVLTATAELYPSGVRKTPPTHVDRTRLVSKSHPITLTGPARKPSPFGDRSAPEIVQPSGDRAEPIAGPQQQNPPRAAIVPPKLKSFRDVLRETEDSTPSKPDAFDPDEFNRKYGGQRPAGS